MSEINVRVIENQYDTIEVEYKRRIKGMKKNNASVQLFQKVMESKREGEDLGNALF